MTRNHLVRVVTFAVAVYSLSLSVRAQSGTDLPAPEQQFSSDRPAYPVVLRLNPDAIRSVVVGEVNHREKVQRTVLGTRSVGESHTTGEVFVDVDLPSEPNGAVFVVRFHGTTLTKTVGENGPAIIHSRTNTK